jgi:hypothetical protein
MRPRRPGLARQFDLRVREIQRFRLDLIAEGRAEPCNARERGYLMTLRLRGRADPAQFVVSAALFLEEQGMGAGH